MIGVFDSGLGGLTVVRELQKQCPEVDILYFGDTARTPYGTKGPEAVTRFSLQIAELLISKGADMIIIACNTASAFALDVVQKAHPKIPVLGVIAPAATAALQKTKGRIGVIGTRGTIASGVYQALLEKAAIYTAACPLFVPLVEEGWARKPEAATIAKTYLNPLRLRRIDTLILGCTHYPLLLPVIRRALPKVVMIDPAKEVVKAFLEQRAAAALQLQQAKGKTSKVGKTTFVVSEITPYFAKIAEEWLGQPVQLTKITLS